MRAELTRYAVPGWGRGELWTSGELVLAHDFHFTPVSDTDSRTPSASSGTNVGKHVDDYAWTDSSRVAGCGRTDILLPPAPLDTNSCLTPTELVERLIAFFAGEAVAFDDVDLDLSDATPFQRAAATALRSVRRGEVVSYAELAALAGHPGAQRAVGTFCARNRFMVLIPCHRVVGMNGIGGYGSAGVAVKRRLLALESVVL